MPRTVAIGVQSFAELRERGCFLVDKTAFVTDWWRAEDHVTLVCRPRRFGKTLNMSMVECFFSNRYAGRADLFEGMRVWDEPDMRAEQGAWPVVAVSFSAAKGSSAEAVVRRICEQIAYAWRAHRRDIDEGALGERERDVLTGKAPSVDPLDAPSSLARLCELLALSAGRRCVVLLDEYDTPLHEAWVGGFWDEVSEFVRALFNATFKSNPNLERALLTGITRVARESIFSDLNNPKVVTATSPEYATSFGFTEAEVLDAMGEFGLDGPGAFDDVRRWYDGFVFGGVPDIYNPWSITNYLDTGRLAPYWANTSGNALVSKIVREGDADLKADFETLLSGDAIEKQFDEQVSFDDLGRRPGAVWGLLVAGGYLRVTAEGGEGGARGGSADLAPAGIAPSDLAPARLSITNHEVALAFDGMVRGWFDAVSSRYNGFVRALLAGDLDAMNAYMNDVALDTFSLFDTGARPSGTEPERFYHGFVLGLLVELRGRYIVRSNRESGFGRYDVMLEPVDPARDDGIVLEFKVRNPRREETLEDTVASALAQIADQGYANELVSRGVPADRVRAYGFAFEGKRVLIG